MRKRDAPKAGWAGNFPAWPPDKDGLARIVEADGGRDDTENSYYEEAAEAFQGTHGSPKPDNPVRHQSAGPPEPESWPTYLVTSKVSGTGTNSTCLSGGSSPDRPMVSRS